MSIKTCKQHTKEPVFIYAACAGCEIQRYRDQEKALNAEIESLRADAERYRYARDNLIYLSDWTDDEIDAAISSPENPS